jgi:nucleoid-associated protein YgaU
MATFITNPLEKKAALLRLSKKHAEKLGREQPNSAAHLEWTAIAQQNQVTYAKEDAFQARVKAANKRVKLAQMKRELEAVAAEYRTIASDLDADAKTAAAKTAAAKTAAAKIAAAKIAAAKIAAAAKTADPVPESVKYVPVKNTSGAVRAVMIVMMLAVVSLLYSALTAWTTGTQTQSQMMLDAPNTSSSLKLDYPSIPANVFPNGNTVALSDAEMMYLNYLRANGILDGSDTNSDNTALV